MQDNGAEVDCILVFSELDSKQISLRYQMFGYFVCALF